MEAEDIIQTPVLDPQAGEGLSPVQAKAVLDYFVSCGDRLSQMTKTYHDVEAVTRLLQVISVISPVFDFFNLKSLIFQEKENDLELAAKIGQELLERNKRLEDRVNGLEIQLSSSTELITQLRHELSVKSDLLHVYTNDAIEESSPVNEYKNFNLELLQKRIRDLEEDNKRLVAEATELAKEAEECEAKEEKLVTDAVKHLTEANVQINYLSKKFTTKSDESHKQKEEITHLLAQVSEFLTFLKLTTLQLATWNIQKVMECVQKKPRLLVDFWRISFWQFFPGLRSSGEIQEIFIGKWRVSRSIENLSGDPRGIDVRVVGFQGEIPRSCRLIARYSKWT